MTRGRAPESLLERCQAGDERAWREVVMQRASQIYRWAVLLGLSAADAEDAAQEVLLTASRRIDTCADEKAMTSWLYQITRRVAANHRRRAWLKFWRVGRSPMDESAFVHAAPLEREQEIEARRCLRRLKREQAEVLIMIDIIGLTREESARILEVPAGTVASRLRRGREAFRRLWTLTGAEAPPRGAEPSPEEAS